MGVVLVVAGFARLGFISNFLSKSVVTGFVFGLAITIMVGQIPKLFGLPAGTGTSSSNSSTSSLSWATRTCMPWRWAGVRPVLILLFRPLCPRVPGALVALVLGIAARMSFELSAHGVSVVGEFTDGHPDCPAYPDVQLSDIPYLLIGAVGIVFLAVGESLGPLGRSPPSTTTRSSPTRN